MEKSSPRKIVLLCSILVIFGLAFLLIYNQYSTSNDTFTFVQISDTHISPRGKPVHNTETDKGLKDTIIEINKMDPRPEFVIHTGDIAAYNGDRRAYLRYLKLIEPLEVPIYHVLGNHDDRTSFREVVGGQKEALQRSGHYYSFMRGKYLFVILDSLGSREGKRTLGKKQLDWLKLELTKFSDKEVFIFLHHPLCRRFKSVRQALHAPDRLLSLLDLFPNVRYIVNGHIHRSAICKKGRLLRIGSRALSYSYSPEDLLTGYRLFKIRKGGTLDIYDKPIGKDAVSDLEERPAACRCLK